MKSSLAEIAQITGSTEPNSNSPITGWSIDSRTIAPGDLYFALRGEQHDGHSFVNEVLAKGATGAVVSDGRSGQKIINVSDTLQALSQCARVMRCRWGREVVGVTGSAGKTTTKDVIAHLLAAAMRVSKTVGNLNNHIGLPLSILRIDDDSRAAVLEMGMNHAGEIRELAAIAKPQIGVITNIGYAHAEFFADGVAGIAQAKWELVESLEGRLAVLNGDDAHLQRLGAAYSGRKVFFGLSEACDVRPSDVEFTADGARFTLRGMRFESPLAGRHGLSNVLAGLAVAAEHGIAPALLAEALRTFRSGKMRGERIQWNGMTVLNDCYNSNPEAVRAMIDVLAATPASRRIAVLGEMLELGSSAAELHRQIGGYAADRGVDIVVGVHGSAADLVRAAEHAGSNALFFETSDEAGAWLRENAKNGDAILLKGSRGIRVERALEVWMTAAQAGSAA